MEEKRHFKRSFSILLICLALIGFQGSLFAGVTGKIAGTIIDAETGNPLPGANVIIVGTTLGASTDLDGDFIIVNISPGRYSIEASMIGYSTVTKTDLIVNADRTIRLDFELKSTILESEEITVVAEREAIAMDVSSTRLVVDALEIESMPNVTNLEEILNLQAGIENDLVRGGGLDQTLFMVDGLMLIDNYSNTPVNLVNLSAIKEINIIKGGFDAEYGNVRSGVINIITKEGSASEYHASIDFRYIPAHRKHGGESLFDPTNYYLRPYLDPQVCWIGTEKGWDKDMQKQYPEFGGWNELAAQSNGEFTPEDLRNRFMWYHRVVGSGKLGQEEGEYGQKPDWNMDLSLSGPVPGVSKMLGDLTFFASYKTENEMFALPTSREFFKRNSGQLKLTSRITPSMKITLEGMYGETNTVANGTYTDPLSAIPYYSNGDDILWGSHTDTYRDGGYGSLYWPAATNPYDIYQTMVGFSLDHALSPTTFYNLRVSYIKVENECTGPVSRADTSKQTQIGNISVYDEIPFGFSYSADPTLADGNMFFAQYGAGPRDKSVVNTIHVKFDMTSQIDKYNEIKFGGFFNYDELDVYYADVVEYAPNLSRKITSDKSPIRIGAYIQDKIEFEGLAANIGVRFDYNDPNTEWYTADRYSEYFTSYKKDEFTANAPTETAKGNFKISPRLGIAHPISENAKLYFSYGHFYSMPTSRNMYTINYGNFYNGIAFIGNPSAEAPRTIQYELGLDYDIADMALLNISAYYKDVTNQSDTVGYHNIDGSVNYETSMPTNYEDIRGFEVRLQKTFGQWITGWINYTYELKTWGTIGRSDYYENVQDERLYGLQNPVQQRKRARPYARANIALHSPSEWGPEVLGVSPFADMQISAQCYWKAGQWTDLADYLDIPIASDDYIEQWEDYYDFDLRISKRINIDQYSLSLFVDIQNVFNLKYLDTRAFSSTADARDYYKSLHLPLYKKDEFKNYPELVGGDDKIGDVKSADKPYINDPDRGFLAYLNPRYITLGIRVNF